MSMWKTVQLRQASSKPYRAILVTVRGLKNGQQSKHKNIFLKKIDSPIGQSAWNSKWLHDFCWKSVSSNRNWQQGSYIV